MTPPVVTVTQFNRPFAETFSSTAPSNETGVDELRRGYGLEPTPVGCANFSGDDSSQSWFWTAQWQVGEREAQEDINACRGDFYENSDAFLKSL